MATKVGARFVSTLAAVSLLSGFAAVSRAHAVPQCDPSVPATCTLREVANLAGMRIGATLEPSEIASVPYSTTLATHFNALTPENALKLYTIEPQLGQWDFGPADAVVDFAEANYMAVRGHTLVWAQDVFTPTWTKAITDPTQLRTIVQEYIAAVMGRYAGRIHRYDVVNEPLQTLGTGASCLIQ